MYQNKDKSTLWLTEYNTPYDAYSHGIVKVLFKARTEYQDMMIVETGAYGKALVLDGCWQSSSGDEFMYHEPLVHPAFLMNGHPRNVLILGGGEGACLREALKWKTVERAVMVDLDGEVVAACREHLPEMHRGAFDDARTEIVIGDAYDFIDKHQCKWDVVISDLTDPLEDGPSFKLFTRDYFEKCRRALTKNGVFVLQAGLAGPVEMKIHVRLAATVGSVFASMRHYISQVPTWASPMGFVIGTDQSLQGFDPQPEDVDRILKTNTDNSFRMFDGRALRGLLNPPKYLRDAVAAETRLYTLNAPPNL